MNKTKFSLQDLTNSDIEQGLIELHNTYPEIAHISFEADLPYLTISPSELDLKPDERTSVNYSFDAASKQDFGNFMEKIPVTAQTALTRKKGFIYFTGSIKEDFSGLTPEQRAAAPVIKLNSYVIDLGEIDPESDNLLEVPVINAGGSDLIIRKIEISRYCSLVEFDKIIGPGTEGLIKLRITPQVRRSNFYTDFSIICNDPEKPVNKIRISGNIKN